MVAYAASALPEASSRLDWLSRTLLELPPVLTLAERDPARIPADLRPGTEVSVSAVPIALEAVLLRDGGLLDPERIAVQGLGRPPTTVRVDAAGDIPLPAIGRGAWLVVASGPTNTARTVLLRGDLTVTVSQGGLVHVRRAGGAPVAGADLWLFTAAGPAGARSTDPLGTAWVGTLGIGVLARSGGSWAWTAPDEASVAPYPARAENAYDGLLQQNEDAYNEMFRQDQVQRVQASGL